MYAPRTGGPGHWPPSPELTPGAEQKHPKPGTVEYKIVASKSGSAILLHMYEVTWKKRGKSGRLIRLVRAVCEPPTRCDYCEEIHDNLEDAYDCCAEYLMLEAALEESEPDWIRIANERGHDHG